MQREDQANSQEAQHVDLQHGKFLLAVVARIIVPYQHNNQPLSWDDYLHGEESESDGGFPTAPGSCEAQQSKAASQQAGESQGEEHAEEEDPGGADLWGETDDKGEGDGQDPSCGQQEHEQGGYWASNSAALISGGGTDAQGPEQQAEEENDAEQEARRGQSLHDNPPCCPPVTQVPVDGVQSCATAWHAVQGREIWGRRRSGWGAVGWLAQTGERDIDEEEEGEQGCVLLR